MLNISWTGRKVLKFIRRLHKLRAAYYSKLIEENKNNLRFLFSSGADRESHLHRTQYPSIAISLWPSLMILTIRNKIPHLLPSVCTNTPSRTEISETAQNPTNYLDSFSLIPLDQLTRIISCCKPTTCVLDPIPTKLLEEVLPLIDSTLLNTIDLSLSSGCTTVLSTSCNQTPSQKTPWTRRFLTTDRYPTPPSCLNSWEGCSQSAVRVSPGT